jgi:serine/threonine protein kinase
MEYADSGTLQEYLKERFDNLSWNNKLNMALQLACAVLCLHDEGIIHCDLVIHLLYLPHFIFFYVCCIIINTYLI